MYLYSLHCICFVYWDREKQRLFVVLCERMQYIYQNMYKTRISILSTSHYIYTQIYFYFVLFFCFLIYFYFWFLFLWLLFRSDITCEVNVIYTFLSNQITCTQKHRIFLSLRFLFLYFLDFFFIVVLRKEIHDHHFIIFQMKTMLCLDQNFFFSAQTN